MQGFFVAAKRGRCGARDHDGEDERDGEERTRRLHARQRIPRAPLSGPIAMVGTSDGRPARELPDRPSGRGRSRDRDRPRARAAPSAADPGDDRLGELRAAGGPRRGGLGADQQVRRGLPRPPLLRRLRGGRRRRAAGDRSRQGALRRRPRQRPAARRRAGQQRRLLRPAAARRHDPRPRPRPRRPPQPRDENQRLGQVLQPGRLPRAPRGLLGRHGRGRAPRRRAQAEDDHRRLDAPTRGSSTSPSSARSPTRSAPC